MTRYKDITGQRYGKLTAIEYVGTTETTRKAIWKFRCDCGNTIEIRVSKVKDGQYVSCGCWRKTKNITHGLSNTRIYSIWCDMKKRCNNENTKHYNYYGGRGIKLCEDWNNFESFYEWSMNNGYNDNLTIDRINVNGDYEPSNCRWVSMITQHYNKRNTIHVEIDGIKKTLREISEEYNLKYDCVYTRFIRGKNVLDGSDTI